MEGNARSFEFNVTIHYFRFPNSYVTLRAHIWLEIESGEQNEYAALSHYKKISRDLRFLLVRYVSREHLSIIYNNVVGSRF